MRTDLARQLRFWSTASVEPARAFKFWVDTLCSEMVELRVWITQKGLARVESWRHWLPQQVVTWT